MSSRPLNKPGVAVATTFGDGISLTGNGTGNLVVHQLNFQDATDSISTVFGDGIIATQGASATGGIHVDFAGNISTDSVVGGAGVQAVTFNSAATALISLTLGNVTSGGTGVFAQ